MPDFFTVKHEIWKNEKLLEKWEHGTFKLSKYEIDNYLKLLRARYEKDFGNGVYAKIAVILEEKTGIKLSEDAVRKRLERMK